MNSASHPLFRKFALFLGFSILLSGATSAAQGMNSHVPSQATVATHTPEAYTELFFSTVAYDSGGQAASAFLVADINGDGKMDVIILNASATQPNGNSQIGVLLGNGDGTFQPATVFDVGASGTTLASGDVNGDGKLDLVVGNGGDDNSVSLLLGNGDGTFGKAVIYSTNTSYDNGYVPVAIADVNGDGRGDVVALTSGGISVLLGNADGTLQPALTSFANNDFNLNALTLADLNHDGKLDAVTLSCYSNCIGGNADVWMGVGNGTFSGNTEIGPGGNAWMPPLFVGDVNGDGIPDLVFGNGDALSVALGKGDGSFNAEQTYCLQCGTFGGGALSMVVTDLNHDGWPDIAVVNGALIVFLNDGKGGFYQTFNYEPVGRNADAVIVKSADLNKDGKPDLILLQQDPGVGNGDSNVEVLLGNGDGTFSGGGLIFDSGGVLAQDMAVLDLNGDGRADVLALNFCTIQSTCAAGAGREGSLGALLNNKSFVFKNTTTSFTSSPNPSIYGQNVTLTATVKSKSGTPDGTVYFEWPNSGLYSFATLVNGAASLTAQAFYVGTTSITAQYQGSENFGGSESSPLNQSVQPATTVTTAVSSLNPAKVGQVVKYSASVQSQYGGGVGGYVTIFDGGTAIGIISFGVGPSFIKAKYSTPGTHVITASYPGDGSNLPSTSGPLSEQVKAPTSTTVSSSGSPSQAGQPVTFTAAITSAYGAIPDGEIVTFYNGSQVLGTEVTSGGKASLTTSSLSAKKHTIKAVYPGDALFEPSKGVIVQVVQP